MTQDKWAQAIEASIEAVKKSTIEALMRDAEEVGFITPTEDKLYEYRKYFIQSLEHAFTDMSTKMCKDIDENIDKMLEGGC